MTDKLSLAARVEAEGLRQAKIFDGRGSAGSRWIEMAAHCFYVAACLRALATDENKEGGER